MAEFKVMVVDDEQDFLESLIERLNNRDIEASGFTSAEEALVAMQSHNPDVVILDVRLPGISGIEMLQRIKNSHPFTEVVILTGYADTKIAIRVMELGAFDYLVKPVEIDELVYRLKDAYKSKTIHERTGRGENRASASRLSGSGVKGK